ncbi:hypothetical protein ACFL96_09235 [Thermoproteota archaeon]
MDKTTEDLYRLVQKTCTERGILDTRKELPDYVFLGNYIPNYDPNSPFFERLAEVVTCEKGRSQPYELRYWGMDKIGTGVAKIITPDETIKIVATKQNSSPTYRASKTINLHGCIPVDLEQPHADADYLHFKVERLEKRLLKMGMIWCNQQSL